MFCPACRWGRQSARGSFYPEVFSLFVRQVSNERYSIQGFRPPQARKREPQKEPERVEKRCRQRKTPELLGYFVVRWFTAEEESRYIGSVCLCALLSGCTLVEARAAARLNRPYGYGICF